ncbi:carbamoyltransferase C-terminal domain-containing protein [Bradyrhizobium sp. McL0616]|uniref:carbamoyltransferase C-terminal domain-containing protein n=1 Tax=Bradyrhizobium sp. McL0616 TaxID=3415674 RepID=UPI003CF8B909
MRQAAASNGINYELDPELDKRRRDAEIFTSDFSTRQERIFSEKMEEILGPRRLRGQPLDQRLTNIAASGQKQLEIVATEVIRTAIRETGCGDVCIAGGVGLNCKMNMEIAAEPGVKRLYVPPVPHDAGVALGAAMLKCAEAGHRITPLTHAYWGPEYSNDTIRETLDKIGARFELLDDPVARCVTDLADQKTVGWFQGRMEYGPRAGQPLDPGRSAPRGHEGPHQPHDQVREEFRPFCPSVLYDRQADYFENAFDAPFMVVTFPVNAKVAETMPAVVHVDNTARIQSVYEGSNPLYSRLIGAFAKAASLPVLINTSLNINEQPTANAPLEALHTYFCSGLDVLYLGNYRLSKSPRAAA